MTRGKALAGRIVVNTRPVHQAAGLSALLAEAGAKERCLPLLQIRPLEHIQWPNSRPDAVMVTSRNAVDALPQDLRTVPFYALGATTGAALRARGLWVAEVLDGATSEAMLDLSALQAVRGQQWWIVAGEGGRTLLRERLEARGAVVYRVATYVREPVPHAPKAIYDSLSGAEVAIVTSGEALQALLPMLATLPAPLPGLVLPSARVAAIAPPHLRCEIADAMRDSALVDACRRLLNAD